MAKYNVHGTQLQASDMAASPSFTTVAQIESVTLPGESRGSEDVPTHDDAPGSVATKLVDAVRSLQPFQVTIVEDLADATHDDATGLYSFLADTEPRDFKFILSDDAATEIAVPAWITGRTPQAFPANRGAARVDYEFTPTDEPTIT